MSAFLMPTNTTLHWDGALLIEKSVEQVCQAKESEKHLDKAKKDIEARIKKWFSFSTCTYTTLKSLYKVPSTIMNDIITGMESLGWNICRCPFQADTCLAQQVSSQDDIAIVLGDSDPFVYEQVMELMMPVWRNRKKVYKTFSKVNFLKDSGLPLACHLVLAVILSPNDYFTGFKGMPLKNVIKIIKSVQLDDIA
ncbi:hypothetical protein CPB97_002780 [Podila verticillata]|nr:hypothetical protein CPB97_002780 [Podila verticillata]